MYTPNVIDKAKNMRTNFCGCDWHSSSISNLRHVLWPTLRRHAHISFGEIAACLLRSNRKSLFFGSSRFTFCNFFEVFSLHTAADDTCHLTSCMQYASCQDVYYTWRNRPMSRSSFFYVFSSVDVFHRYWWNLAKFSIDSNRLKNQSNAASILRRQCRRLSTTTHIQS